MDLRGILRRFSGQGKAAPVTRAEENPQYDSPLKPRYLVVGLGNPGADYRLTRHNVGFRVVEQLARHWQLRFERPRKQARLAMGEVAGLPVALLEPLAYMNLSGKPVALALRELVLLPAAMLVVHDDVDLPLGRLRLRPRGSAAGHKGVQSLMDSLGTADFARLRVGIGRPGHGDVRDYVLTPFASDDEPAMEEVLEKAASAIECYLTAGVEAAMNEFNRAENRTADSPRD